jgi:hypothetical protein
MREELTAPFGAVRASYFMQKMAGDHPALPEVARGAKKAEALALLRPVENSTLSSPGSRGSARCALRHPADHGGALAVWRPIAKRSLAVPFTSRARRGVAFFVVESSSRVERR